MVQTQEEPERHLTLLGDKLGTKKCHHNGSNGMYSGRRREISVYVKDVVAWTECGQEWQLQMQVASLEETSRRRGQRPHTTKTVP